MKPRHVEPEKVLVDSHTAASKLKNVLGGMKPQHVRLKKVLVD
jgi:hypothetical protein